MHPPPPSPCAGNEIEDAVRRTISRSSRSRRRGEGRRCREGRSVAGGGDPFDKGLEIGGELVDLVRLQAVVRGVWRLGVGAWLDSFECRRRLVGPRRVGCAGVVSRRFIGGSVKSMR